MIVISSLLFCFDRCHPDFLKLKRKADRRPMFLHLNPAQKEIQKKVRALVAAEIAPHAVEIDARDEFPRTSYEAFIKAGLFKTFPADSSIMGRKRMPQHSAWSLKKSRRPLRLQPCLVFPTQAVIRIIREVGTGEQQERFFFRYGPG